MNSLNYARAFAGTHHEFIVAVLISKRERKYYEKLVSQFDETLCSNVTFSPIFLESPNENFHNFLHPRSVIHDIRAILQTLRTHRPDAVIGMYVIHAYPLVFFKKLLKFRLFTIVSGGDLYLHTNHLWRMIRRLVYSNSEAIFAVAKSLNREIREESGRESIFTPTGADTRFFHPIDQTRIRRKYGYDEDVFVLLTLSLLIKRKCIDDVIRAFKQCVEENRKAKLKMIIAGEGPEKSNLIRLCHELRLTEHIEFIGFVSEDTKLELFNLANVYVLASHAEGMPFSLMEAMASGCICIGSDVGDIPKILQDGRNGFLIHPREPQVLAEKIGQILRLSTTRVQAIRCEARKSIVRNYDFLTLSKQMIATVEKKCRE